MCIAEPLGGRKPGLVGERGASAARQRPRAGVLSAIGGPGRPRGRGRARTRLCSPCWRGGAEAEHRGRGDHNVELAFMSSRSAVGLGRSAGGRGDPRCAFRAAARSGVLRSGRGRPSRGRFRMREARQHLAPRANSRTLASSDGRPRCRRPRRPRRRGSANVRRRCSRSASTRRPRSLASAHLARGALVIRDRRGADATGPRVQLQLQKHSHATAFASSARCPPTTSRSSTRVQSLAEANEPRSSVQVVRGAHA